VNWVEVRQQKYRPEQGQCVTSIKDLGLLAFSLPFFVGVIANMVGLSGVTLALVSKSVPGQDHGLLAYRSPLPSPGIGALW